MAMLRLLMLCVGCACIAAMAADGNAIHSDACRQAIDRLTVQEARQASTPPTESHAAVSLPQSPSPLQVAQRDTARDCLGVADAPATATRQAQPVIALPAPLKSAVARVPAPIHPPPTPSAPSGPPIVLPQPPAFVTACDATGCWGSDGTRLDRVGPDTHLRNHQMCNARGGLLQCP